MLPEERELRKWYVGDTLARKTQFYKAITALVRAVREDCAKVAEGFRLECENDQPEATWAVDKIAAEIRGRK